MLGFKGVCVLPMSSCPLEKHESRHGCKNGPKLTFEDDPCFGLEKVITNMADLNRGYREEIAVIIKGGKESHAEAAIGKSIQNRMG